MQQLMKEPTAPCETQHCWIRADKKFLLVKNVHIIAERA